MRLFPRYTMQSVEAPRTKYRGLSRSVEQQAQAEGYRLVAGIDEAGRGALAGPVVAAAIILPPQHRIAHIVDSKCLSPAQREYLFCQLLAEKIGCAVGIVPADQIDALNIRQAALKAMAQAVTDLQPQPDFALIDGPDAPSLAVPHRCITDGDASCYCIAAASIIAKVFRDGLMEHLAGLYPHYGFERNRGYGTSEHLTALRKYGPSLVHRRSFAPVKQLSQMELLSDWPRGRFTGR